MSAFIVGQDHIDFLVTAATALGNDALYWNQHPGREPHGYVRVTLDNANEFGAMLWSENIASVQYRYSEDEYSDLPGPIPTPFAHEYTYRPLRLWQPYNLLTPRDIAQVCKAIRCYVYQSCEHPEWETSEAKRMCDHLLIAYVSRLPGYEDAEWEVSRADLAAR